MTWIPSGRSRPLARTLLVFAAVATVAGLSAFVSLRAALPELQLSTPSSRPDMVTGGDALVRVEMPASIKARDVRITLGGADVTRMFRADGGGPRFTGVGVGRA